MKFIFISLFIACLMGCAGTAIPTKDYSPLETPQQTFQFAQKAVVHDDPQAFYYCLSETTRQKVSLSDLKLGWALAGGFFYLFLEAKLKSIEIPAPEPMFHKNPNTAKVTLESNQIDASFLLHKEGNQWKLFYPSPYPLPDIGKIKKRGRTPWRFETSVCYRTYPDEWLRATFIQRNKPLTNPSRKPAWRIQ